MIEKRLGVLAKVGRVGLNKLKQNVFILLALLLNKLKQDVSMVVFIFSALLLGAVLIATLMWRDSLRFDQFMEKYVVVSSESKGLETGEKPTLLV